MKTKPKFVIEYLNGNLRRFAKDGRSLPIVADSMESAVIHLLGAPADSWDGNHFSKWDGKLKGRVEQVA